MLAFNGCYQRSVSLPDCLDLARQLASNQEMQLMLPPPEEPEASHRSLK